MAAPSATHSASPSAARDFAATTRQPQPASELGLGGAVTPLLPAADDSAPVPAWPTAVTCPAEPGLPPLKPALPGVPAAPSLLPPMLVAAPATPAPVPPLSAPITPPPAPDPAAPLAPPLPALACRSFCTAANTALASTVMPAAVMCSPSPSAFGSGGCLNNSW